VFARGAVGTHRKCCRSIVTLRLIVAQFACAVALRVHGVSRLRSASSTHATTRRRGRRWRRCGCCSARRRVAAAEACARAAGCAQGEADDSHRSLRPARHVHREHVRAATSDAAARGRVTPACRHGSAASRASRATCLARSSSRSPTRLRSASARQSRCACPCTSAAVAVLNAAVCAGARRTGGRTARPSSPLVRGSARAAMPSRWLID
jgi:hypothetical protein